MTPERLGIGIDLGSSAVRIGLYDVETDELLKYSLRRVRYYTHDSEKVTQSTAEIMQAIYAAFTDLGNEMDNVVSCGVAATCSLAAFTYRDGKYSPIPVYRTNATSKDIQNVVFWMDRSAKNETHRLNEVCLDVTHFMGGGFIPEMGIPKLMKLIENLPQGDLQFAVLDLHQYIAFELGRKFGWNTTRTSNSPNTNGIGHDGELSGWSKEFYKKKLKLPAKVNIGPYPQPLTDSRVTVSSCIDCYANWFGACPSQPETSLFLAAGTSTCYLRASKNSAFIPGIWGPFTNILESETHGSFNVYEAGQSCTGKFFEYLFEVHPAARDYKGDPARLFEDLEKSCLKIEKVTGRSVHFAAKGIFTYGELQGNRTPYCDPAMSGVFMGITPDVSFKNLTLQYIAAIEFLAFEVKEMTLQLGNEIDYLIVVGSQAKNKRLLSLISLINNDIDVKISEKPPSLIGIRGAYLLGKASRQNRTVLDVIREQQNETKLLQLAKSSINHKEKPFLKELMEVKYEIHLEIAQTQRKFRSMINAISSQPWRSFLIKQ
ncbi:LAMI_0F02784g1_1 [Lachancea mirantina]|uniref:LAMI_0F02784g1_1 n=1 Tax=Lachancea mirantina TaxID=1230905 RepID=A0A1G4JX25_9SACH|nr:LAMI_0F02784g1_1 [Lachancea mirantina]